MSDGRKGRAPCGHIGEAVIGQFYLCPHGCGKPKPTVTLAPKRVQNTQHDPRIWTFDLVDLDDDEVTPVVIDKCPFCGSHDIAPFTDPFRGAAHHCIDCGRVWQ